jgi:rubrerythrin
VKRIIPEYTALVDIIQDALDKEKDAQAYYLEAADMAQAAEIRDFLLEMAAMEKEHVDLLTRKLEALRSNQIAMNGILSSFEADPRRDDTEER